MRLPVGAGSEAVGVEPDSRRRVKLAWNEFNVDPLNVYVSWWCVSLQRSLG
jgi:hypothetical protein